MLPERDRSAVLKNRADDRLMMKLGNVQTVLNLQDYTVEGLKDHMMGFMGTRATRQARFEG